MVARVTSASLGLFAFAVTAASGLYVRNPVEVTLSRCILALVVFCIVGFVLGGVAQQVITEHQRQREAEIRKRFGVDDAGTDDGSATEGTLPGEGEPSAG